MGWFDLGAGVFATIVVLAAAAAPKMQHHEAVNILLVDHDDAQVEHVGRAFRDADFRNPVRRARDGTQALQMLRGGAGHELVEHPRLVVLELRLPGMDGLRFLSEVRADVEIADTVVFVLTGSTDRKDVAAAYERNVAGYVMKSEQGTGLRGLVELLDAYCRAVELPGPQKVRRR